jgi:hypothetical protein
MEKRRTEPATYKETVQHYQELRAAVFEFSQAEFSHLAVTLRIPPMPATCSGA